MNKAYFKQTIRRSYKSILFILVVGLLIYPLVIATSSFNRPYGQGCQVGLAITFLAFLCYIIPVFKNAYLTKKRTIDCYYSLPIKRVSIMNINLLVGFLEIIIPYTIIYFLGFLIMLTKEQTFVMSFYLPLYLVSVAISIPVYIFNYFVCSRANSVVDSIIFMVIYTFLFAIVFQSIEVFYEYAFVSKEDYAIIQEWTELISFWPFVNVGNHYADLIRYDVRVPEDNELAMSTFAISFWILVGILSYLGLFFFTKSDKSERAEQVSNSWFGYQILTPICYTCGLFLTTYNGDFSSVIMAYGIFIVFFLIGSVIYNRKIKLPKITYIVLGGCTLFNTVIIIILNVIVK